MWCVQIGMPKEQAREVVLKDKPDAAVYFVRQGMAVTMDYRLDRVRIFLDENDRVVHAPTIG